MSHSDPPDCLDLLRIVWSPDDVVDGQVQPSAFEKNDLRSRLRCLSVDRADMIRPDVVRHTACVQQRKARESVHLNGKREESYLTILNAGAVREVYLPPADSPVLSVLADPIIDDDPLLHNPGHCSIANTSAHNSRSFLLGLQTRLAALTRGTKPLEDALTDVGSA